MAKYGKVSGLICYTASLGKIPRQKKHSGRGTWNPRNRESAHTLRNTEYGIRNPKSNPSRKWKTRVLRKDISIVSTKTQNLQKYRASGIRG